MKITTTKTDRCLKVQLKGELDHHGAIGLLNRLELEIEASVPRELILDFSGVTFMDSAGIAVALRGWQRMRDIGGDVKLRNVAPQPKKVFEASGICRMMEVK